MADVPAKGYEINQRALNNLLHGKARYPDLEPIWYDLNRRAESVKNRAQALVHRRTGRTAASIDVTSRLFGYGWRFTIEAHTRYSYMLHEGTHPHLIRGPSRFPGRGGAVIEAQNIHHPGSRANPFLREALPAFMAARDVIR